MATPAETIAVVARTAVAAVTEATVIVEAVVEEDMAVVMRDTAVVAQDMVAAAEDMEAAVVGAEDMAEGAAGISLPMLVVRTKDWAALDFQAPSEVFTAGSLDLLGEYPLKLDRRLGGVSKRDGIYPSCSQTFAKNTAQRALVGGS